MSGSGRARGRGATEDESSEPRQERKTGLRRWALALVLSAVMVVAVVAAFALVSVNQSTPFSFSIEKNGSGTANVTHPLSFAHSGTIVFSWATEHAVAVTFSFRVAGSDTPLKSTAGTAGNITVHVQGNTLYAFGIQGIYPAVCQVNGKLQFFAPVLAV